MSTKGDEQGKKSTANTVALKTLVRGWGTKVSIHLFFPEKRN